MLEALDAYPGQCLETLGQSYLILDKKRPGLQVFLVMGCGSGQGRAGLAEHGIEDIDGVRRCPSRRALDDRLVVVVLVLDAGQQGMGETGGIEVPRQVQLHVPVGPLQLAIVEVTVQGAAVRLQGVGFHGVAFEAAVKHLHATGQCPVVVQRVVEAQLSHVVVIVQQVVAAFFPDVGITRGAAFLRGIAGQASVERVVVTHEVTLENDPGRLVDLPAQHGRNVVTLTLDIVAETLATFAQQVQTIRQ